MILIFSGVFAYAVGTPNKEVWLPPTEYSVETAYVFGTYKIFAGRNFSNSARSVKIQAHWTTGDGWIANAYAIVGVNSTSGDFQTKRFDTERMWKLKVSNEPSYLRGADAKGWIWYAN